MSKQSNPPETTSPLQDSPSLHLTQVSITELQQASGLVLRTSRLQLIWALSAVGVAVFLVSTSGLPGILLSLPLLLIAYAFYREFVLLTAYARLLREFSSRQDPLTLQRLVRTHHQYWRILFSMGCVGAAFPVLILVTLLSFLFLLASF